MSVLLLVLLGCDGEGDTRETGDRGVDPAPACSSEPCVSDVAAAAWQGDFDGTAFGGYALET